MQSMLYSFLPSLLVFADQLAIRERSPQCFQSNAVIQHERPYTPLITDPTLRSFADKYLAIGERVFDIAQATAVNSQYFSRDKKRGD